MELSIKLIIPFIGAFIGYITNWVAIKLLFFPREKILGYQGLLPKYRGELTETIAKYVDEHLIDPETVRKYLTQERIAKGIEEFIQKNFSTFKPDNPFLKGNWIAKIISSFLIDDDKCIKKTFIESIPKGGVKKIVYEKMDSMDIDELERLVIHGTRRHLQFIIWAGAILGFIIGGIQVIITTVIL